MTRRYLGIGLATIVSASCVSNAPCPPDAPSTSSPSEAELLKNWALSRCLARAAEGEEAGDDASKSAAAYLERGNAGIAAYEELDALIAEFLQRRYSGSVPSEYNTMKCIDLFHSKALDELVQRNEPRP